MPDRSRRWHQPLCPDGMRLSVSVTRPPCTCRLIDPEETPMPVETPSSYRRADYLAPMPTVVTFRLELNPGASTADVVVFTSDQHTAVQHLPTREWITLGRPGRIETTTMARAA